MAESFGGLLKRIRLSRGLTQESLAERAGISAATIAALERGRRQAPRPTTVRELADSLGLGGAERDEFMDAAFAAGLGGFSDSRPSERRSEETVIEEPPPVGVDERLRPSSHPVPLTPLVGRQTDTAAVTEELLRERFVTLIGPGGVGKTRLAISVAGYVTGKFPGGVHWVDLGALRPAQSLPDTVLALIGPPLVAGQTDGAGPDGDRSQQRVAGLFQGPESLLVLDGCEHIVDAVNAFVFAVLTGSPVSVLATSRQPIGVEGEVCWWVPPLALSDPETVTAETLADADASRLFLERAYRAEPTFTIDDETAVAVARICRRLDGIPLAIELAASRVRLFSTKTLVAELDQRFDLLTATTTGLVPRHQTLLASVMWSYGLLDEIEREVLLGLAAFPADFTLSAAELVVRETAGKLGRVRERWQIVGAFAQLVDKSLVIRRDVSHDPHYGLQETIRAFAGDRAREAASLDAAYDAHAEVYAAWYGRVCAGAAAAEDSIAAGRVEYENLLAAAERLLEIGSPASLDLVEALGPIWQHTGRFRDAVNVGSAALRLAAERGEGWFPRIVSAISPAVRSADPDERFIGLLHGVLAAAASSDDDETARAAAALIASLRAVHSRWPTGPSS